MDAQEVMHMTDYSKITALYSRLSVGDEDRDGGESNSIQNQDDMLRKSAQQDGEQIFVNSVFSKAYDKTAMDAYKESSQAFGVLFSDPKKYAALKSALAEIMYREFCQD